MGNNALFLQRVSDTNNRGALSNSEGDLGAVALSAIVLTLKPAHLGANNGN